MNEKRAQELINKLHQLIGNVKAVKEAGNNINKFSEHLRMAEIDILQAIDDIKVDRESERCK